MSVVRIYSLTNLFNRFQPLRKSENPIVVDSVDAGGLLDSRLDLHSDIRLLIPCATRRYRL
jgi:hypothetical protein